MNLDDSAKKDNPIDGKKLGKQIVREITALLLKFAVIAVLLVILLGYIFGAVRNQGPNMEPSFLDGDLVFYYRIVQGYKADEVVVIHHMEQVFLERVVAVAGDTVDITQEGFVINGSIVQGQHAGGETTQFEEGITFPITVPEGQIFVLGDNRERAVDSRIFGCVEIRKVDGRVIGLFRRRSF